MQMRRATTTYARTEYAIYRLPRKRSDLPNGRRSASRRRDLIRFRKSRRALASARAPSVVGGAEVWPRARLVFYCFRALPPTANYPLLSLPLRFIYSLVLDIVASP